MNATDYRISIIHVPGVHEYRDEVVSRFKEHGALVFEDPLRHGAMWNLDNAFEGLMATEKASWTLMLDDDMEPLTGWTDEIKMALALSPSPFVSLFHIGGWGKRIAEAGGCYGMGENALYSAAVAVHESVFDGLALWWQRLRRECPHLGKEYDRAYACYAYFAGYHPALTARALFDHDLAFGLGNKSLLGHSGFGQPRSAGLTIASPLPRWETKTVPVNLSNAGCRKLRASLVAEGLHRL